jgi:hypothetical protein
MNNTPSQTITADPIVDIHHFDDAGVYIRTTSSINDPIAGQRMIPALATDVALPVLAAGETAQFDTVAQTWAVVPDLRGTTVYDTATQQAEVWQAVGALPATKTELVPPPESQWDAATQAWVIDVVAVRDAALSRVLRAYQADMNTPITYAGASVQASDADAQTLAGVLTAISNGWVLPQGFAWIDANNQPIAADVAWLTGLSAAMADHKFQAFARLQSAKAAIRAASNETAIRAVNY